MRTPITTTRRILAARALALAGGLLFALPRICLAVTSSGDPLHPLGSGITVQGIIGRLISAILGLLGSISLAMFVYGGITWMMAQGNEEKIKKAKNTLVYAVLGLIIAFAAFEIINLFFTTVLRPSIITPGQ